MTISITLVIVIITCAISISGFSNQRVIDDLIFYPPAIQGRNQYYRFISHGFIHADIGHLAFNMIALYSFGETLELLYNYNCLFGNKGKLFYILLYFLGLIAASVPDFFKHRDSYHFRSLGASGAVSAVIFSSIVLLPTSGIGIIFIPGINIPGYIFAIIYLAVSAYLDRKGGGNINHGAHISGAIFGIVFTLVFVSLFGHINIMDNFIDQIRAAKPFLPDCNF
ncbi:MAG: rhomboid family intramembrane serine protease [Terrimonas sp.]|nr:rhomboid family intramembrane serine protease [Terrimonas sp.]